MAKALVWVLCAMGVGAVATAQTLPPGFQLLPVFTGLTDPTAIRFAQDGRIFVAEKSGLLWAYDGLDDSSPTRVLDLRTQVHNFWDRGFLGLAVSPNFPVDPSVYVAYTHDVYPDLAGPRWGSSDPVSSTSDPCPTPPGPTTNGCVVYGRLSRVVIDPLTLLGVEQPLIQGQWCAQFPSHTVGDLAFGPDGYLYMSAGEGASFHFTDTGQAGNPPNPCNDPIDEGGALRSQDLLTPSDPTTLDGTILRLDVSGPTPLAPPDNPLVSNGVPDDDFIVAMGLRNPFRFTIRPGTSEIWLGDVGWNDWEEIDRLANPLGDVENLGWPCYEGPVEHPTYRTRSLCVALRNGNVPPGIALIAPYFYYSHDDPVVAGETCPTGGASLTGVAFNSGTNFPPGYDGALFFADGARNCIWAMFPGASGDPDPATRVTFLASGSQASEQVRPVDIQLGPDGNLYIADFEGGRIVRVQHTEGNLPPDAVFTASQTSGSGPLTVDFDAGASSDPEDGTNLLYAWDLDGDGAFDDSTSVTPSFTYQQSGVYLVRLRVRDTRGVNDFASTTITVDDTAPIPTITSPGTELLWRVDQEISFSGMAVDPENGPLPPSQLMWEILLHHCATLLSCHSHPLTTIHDTASRSFFAPDHEYPAFLELRLTATDLPSGDWFDTAWAKRREIRIDNSAQAQALDDFPVLVLLDSTRIDYAATSPAGEDLRFTDSVGNVLAHEIEEWDSTGASVVWVKVPHIDAASSAGFIWMYYDNPEASDAQDPTGVWSNGYAAVWHLSADLADSSAYQNDGTNNGSAQVDGALAGGRFFNGTQWIGIPSSPSLEISGTLSLEAWVQIQNPNLSGARRIVDKKNLWTDPAGFDLEQNAALNHVSAVGGNNTNLRAGGIDLDTTWHYLAANFSGTSGSIFVDGVNRTTDSTVNPVVAGTQSLAIGRRSGGGDYWVGALDEVRVSNVGRSASWLAAQYLSMTDSLLNFEDERALAVLSATTAVMLQPETVELTFESSPPGLQIFTSSESVATPFTRTVIVNSLNSVEAPSPQTLDGTAYGFSSWSDGGSQIHFVAAPEAPTTLLASFQVLPPCSDTFDNDGDGLVDYPSDPGCLDAQYDTESPACDDEIDNDGDGKIDWDGAGSSEPDPQCWTAWRGTEAGKRCGLGFELVFLLSLIQSLRRLRRGRRGWTMRSR